MDNPYDCGVCLQAYTGDVNHNSRVPHLLPCGHSVCRQCLHEMVAVHGSTVRCPFDRQLVTMPSGGVIGLPKNFAFIHVMEHHTRSSFPTPPSPSLLPSPREHSPALSTSPSLSRSPSVSDLPSSAYCREHPQRALEMYCLSDEQPICVSCLYEKHRDHDHQLLNEVVTTTIDTLRQRTNTLLEDLQLLEKQHGAHKEAIHTNMSDAQEYIRTACASLREILNKRETFLLDSITDQTQAKLAHVKDEERKVSKLRDQIRELQDQVGEIVAQRTSDQVAVASKGKLLQPRINVLSDAMRSRIGESPIDTSLQVDFSHSIRPLSLALSTMGSVGTAEKPPIQPLDSPRDYPPFGGSSLNSRVMDEEEQFQIESSLYGISLSSPIDIIRLARSVLGTWLVGVSQEAFEMLREAVRSRSVPMLRN